MSSNIKPSSPLVDALKLFFLNKSSVVALFLILCLAGAAISGELLTGKAPTPQELEQMEEAKILGDVFDSDANDWAVTDPNKTELKNKLLPPFSKSDDGKDYYLMGSDHLGRNVAAQLWAGSSISLTIGFLAVSISVLLGVSLGGVSGFYGRSHVRLPFFLTFLFVLLGGIALPLEATLFGKICFAGAALMVALQLGVAIQGKRYGPVIGFIVVLAVSSGIYLFNSYHESETPEGKSLHQARNMHSVADDLLLEIRDMGRARNAQESGEKDSLSIEELTKMQLQLEVNARRFGIHKSSSDLVNLVVSLEKNARGAQEQLDRAKHLEANTAKMKKPGETASEVAKSAFKRNDKWTTEAIDLNESGNKTLAETGKSLPAVQKYAETASASIDEALAACVLADDFEVEDKTAQTQLMLDTWVLVRNAEQAVERTKLIAALALVEGFELPSGAFAGSDLEKQLGDRIAKTKADDTDLRPLLEKAKAVAAKLTVLDKSIADAKAKVKNRLSGKNLTESDKTTIAALPNYDYTDDKKAKDPFYFTLEPSHKLLDRRADHRGVLNTLESNANNLFDSNEGILNAKLLDNSYRYGVYRITRHFITFSIMVLLLIISAALVAAAAQGAAEDMRHKGTGAIFVKTITVDDLIMRFTEIMMTIPVLFLILAVLAMFGRDVYIVMAIIGLTSWMGTTRFVRAEILSLREQDFVQAARALGVKDYRIIWRHLVPNAISPVLVSATLMVASAVLAESTLSFLGIGAQEGQNTWGLILSNGRKFITDAPWLTWIPGIAILVTVLSFNLLGEGLREAFNPKLRGR